MGYPIKHYLESKVPLLNRRSGGAQWFCSHCSFAGPVLNQMSGRDLKAAQQQAKKCEGSGNPGAQAVCCESDSGSVCCAAAAVTSEQVSTNAGECPVEMKPLSQKW